VINLIRFDWFDLDRWIDCERNGKYTKKSILSTMFAADGQRYIHIKSRLHLRYEYEYSYSYIKSVYSTHLLCSAEVSKCSVEFQWISEKTSKMTNAKSHNFTWNFEFWKLVPGLSSNNNEDSGRYVRDASMPFICYPLPWHIRLK